MIQFRFCERCYSTGRIIGQRGPSTGPTVFFVGGIHGNEPSGVVALIEVFEELQRDGVELTGRLIGAAGNLAALERDQRFIQADLNRIWQAGTPGNSANGQVAEYAEQQELFQIIDPLMKLPGPLYFIDLHTTSSDSGPFIAINDQLDNRQFAIKFPVPTVLGIEEYLEGPLLSYLNDFGHVALAFEAGQHRDPKSVQMHKSFIYLAMIAADIIKPHQVPNLEVHVQRLTESGEQNPGFYEVLYRREIAEEDHFVMKPGYRNFSPIQSGEILARDRNGDVRAHRNGRIFMPLYQAIGNDGYFIIRRVPRWALWMSALLRNINFDRLLVLLPGVQRSPTAPDSLVVNRKVARFLANELFHLLGYRRKKRVGDTFVFTRREIVAGQPSNR